MRFEPHFHTEYSNLRLLDCITKLKDGIDYAAEIGLAGLAITEHEWLGGHAKALEFVKEHENLKIVLGNEIYLINERKNNQQYYHFILMAKDDIGYNQLSKLSSRAWMLAYHDRMKDYRVPTLKSEIEEIIGADKGHVIATTACLGGELSKQTLKMIEAEEKNDQIKFKEAHDNIIKFMFWCKNIFGDDFYVECAPGCSAEQIKVNKRLVKIANAFELKMVIGTDAHYLHKNDRWTHKSFLQSKEEEREVDSFYEYSYLQTEEEIIENLKQSNYDETFIKEMFNNSIEILNKIEGYPNFFNDPELPNVPVKDYPKKELNELKNYSNLSEMSISNDIYERYWVNQCVDKLKDLNKFNNEYLNELEEEARVKKIVGGKLNTNMFKYPITLQHYIDMFWECGSTVGAGRGSACAALNHYLLDVTQLDPVKWKLPFFRYMNEERVELGDIDIDLAPSKRPIILQKIKEERGKMFLPNVDNLSKENLGCTYIATYGTASTKNAIQIACRGYRSESFPEGIEVSEAKYLSSLIPKERGFNWSIQDTVYGNKEKKRQPVTTFINEVNQFDGLLDLILGIDGLIVSRGQHASGIILFNDDPNKHCCFMRTASGDIATQYELHDCEKRGLIKYDFLVTSFQDKLTQCLSFLQEAGLMEKDLSLKELYDKYLHPEHIDLEKDEAWDAIINGKVLNCFQFDSDVGSQAAKKIAPHNILELTDANGLMRLMTGGKGEEQPMDKYVRFKNDISLWYDEMREYGLTDEEMKIVEPYFKDSYGVPPSQEQLMKMLMDKDICHFTLAEANTARKIVGKKQMKKIPELREKVLNQAASPCLGNYIWTCGVGPQMGYSFSVIHALAYSCIGYQSALLVTDYNPIYWNTACLIVNSGSLEGDNESSTDYAKVAKAIGETREQGIEVSLIDINNSSFGFRPDVENNRILYGMKALNGIGGEVIEQIILNRPYNSFKEFLIKCPLKKTAMISLIKAGAFDELEKENAKKLGVHPRFFVMTYYISKICEPKSNLTLQNFSTLLKYNLIPNELSFEAKTFQLNKYFKSYKKYQDWYLLDESCEQFYMENFDADDLEFIQGYSGIRQTLWDKMYQSTMDNVRVWLKNNMNNILLDLNGILFKTMWEKYAKEANLSAWEMEALCFYYNEHELVNINKMQYGIEDFINLKQNDIARYWRQTVPIYNLHTIAGTVIAKDDSHSSISLLTTSGVVSVKFTKEYYAKYNKQISEKSIEDGKNHVVEKGWFTRGTKLVITGYRREDTFVAKTYSKTKTHQLYIIENINNKGEIILRHERKGE